MAQNLATPSPYHAHSASSATGLAPSPASSAGASSSQTDVTASPLDAALAPTAAQPVPKARPRLAGASREYERCDLCGESLGGRWSQFAMVSPLTARHVSVCRTCRRAALSEGYRPRA